MKYFCAGVLFYVVFIMTIFAQEQIEYRHLPDPVKRYFPIVYPLDKNVEISWTLEDSLYIARFLDENYPVEVLLKENGFWVNTFLEIQYEYAPSSVKEHISMNYAGFHPEKCLISNNPFNERYYIVKLIPPDGTSASQTVYFTLDGKFAEK